jgi:hypothetical protein
MSDKTKIWMNNAMHRVMLSCDTASFYITKKDYQKLKCTESIQLKMHLMGCKLCRSFNKQNEILSDKINILQENPPKAELSPQKKAEIEELINKS